MKPLLKVMKALGDGTRVKIFKLLQHRTLCVCELTHLLGLSQSAVSKNLKLLEDAGLVTFERQGPWTNYRLDEDSNPYAAAVGAHFKEWLNDDPVIGKLIARAKDVDRTAVCKLKAAGHAPRKPPEVRPTRTRKARRAAS